MRGVAMLPAYARQQLRLPIGEDPVLGLELRQGDASDSLLMFVVAGAPCGDADTRVRDADASPIRSPWRSAAPS